MEIICKSERDLLIRRDAVTFASVHDSQKMGDVLDLVNTASGTWADSAYRIAEIKAALAARGLTSLIHRRGSRNKPLTKR